MDDYDDDNGDLNEGDVVCVGKDLSSIGRKLTVTLHDTMHTDKILEMI